MEDSIVSWFVLFVSSISGAVFFIRAALAELESRKSDYGKEEMA